MAWVGRELKAELVPPLCCGQEGAVVDGAAFLLPRRFSLWFWLSAPFSTQMFTSLPPCRSCGRSLSSPWWAACPSTSSSTWEGGFLPPATRSSRPRAAPGMTQTLPRAWRQSPAVPEPTDPVVTSVTCCCMRDFRLPWTGTYCQKGVFGGWRLWVHPVLGTFVLLNWGQMHGTAMAMGFSCMVQSLWKLLPDLGIYIWQFTVNFLSVCAVLCIVLCFFTLFIFLIQVVTFFLHLGNPLMQVMHYPADSWFLIYGMLFP